MRLFEAETSIRPMIDRPSAYYRHRLSAIRPGRPRLHCKLHLRSRMSRPHQLSMSSASIAPIIPFSQSEYILKLTLCWGRDSTVLYYTNPCAPAELYGPLITTHTLCGSLLCSRCASCAIPRDSTVYFNPFSYPDRYVQTIYSFRKYWILQTEHYFDLELRR